MRIIKDIFNQRIQIFSYREQNLINIFIIIALISSLFLFSNLAFGLTTITVGQNPYQVAVDPTINRAYTSNQADNTVSVIDTSTNTVIDTITVGSGPVSVVVDTTTHRVYTANQGSASVSVIDGTPGSPTENTVIASVSVGIAPAGVGIDEITNRVYVANVFSGTASVIDGTPGSPTENTVLATIPLGGTGTRVGVDPILKQVYITNSFSNSVFVIDSNTNTLIGTITVAPAPVEALVDIDTGLVYVANRAGNSISIIDGNTNTVVNTIPIANGPNGLALDKNNDRLYVSNILADTFSIVDTITNTVLGIIPVGNDPGGIAFDPDTNLIYIANRADTIVSVIDALAPILPTANAGEDQVVMEGDIVSLQGSGIGVGTLSFTWTQISGPMVTLSDPNISNPTFTAPLVSSNTLLTFELVIEDDLATSDPDTVNVIVTDVTTFTLPLVQTSEGLSGSINVGDIEAGTTLNVQFQSPPGVLPLGELKQTLISTGIAGNDVSFDFTINSVIPSSLPPLPLDPALFFDIETQGIDFSNQANFPPNQLPKSRFTLSPDFSTQDTFSDGCPVVSIFLLDEVLGNWDQLGEPIIPNTNKIYVANIADSSISVIDGSTNTIESTIPLVGGTQHVGFDRSSNLLYATNPLLNTVSVIDVLTNNIITTIPVGDGPHGIFIDTDSKRVYISNRGTNTISVIDSNTNTVIDTITVGSGPVYVAINKNTNTLYSSNFFGNSVTVIDSLTNTVIDTIPDITLTGGIDVDENTNRVYVSSFGASLVAVIDGTPGSTTENTILDTITVGGSPSPVVIDPNSNKIYVANFATDTVSVIDKSVNAVIKTILVGDSPRWLAFNPNTNRVFVTNHDSNDVSVIDGSTLSVVNIIPVGNGASGIDINSDVPNPVRDPATDVIDLATGDILQCAYLGEKPHLSKFSIGGIRALALGALVGGGSSSSSGGTAPSMDNISFGGTSTVNEDGTIEFGGVIVDEIGPVNNLPLQTVTVGEPFELRFPFYEDNGINALRHVAVYFLQEGEETVSDSQTSIIYEPNRPVEFSDTNDLISNVTAKSIVKSAYNIDVIFGMTFNFPIDEPLDVLVRSWDKYRRSSDVMFNDLLLVEPNTKISFPTDTSTEQEVPGWNKSIQSSLTKSTTVFKDTYEGSQITFDLENGQSVTKISGIPIWIKNNAYWWSEEKIDDDDFVAGIQHLIDQNIMTVPKRHVISILETPSPIEIPEWVKNNASWWSKGEISDDEFIQSIQWLIEKGIMTV